ncbi:hypothetical protein D3C84_969950 [compost metagenome]
MQKEHKLRELTSIKTIIHTNLHKFDLATIEGYRDHLLQQLDEEINEMDFYNKHTTNTYEEQDYREFLVGYKDKIIILFNEFTCVEMV